MMTFFEERDGANESLGAKLTDWTRKNILGKRESMSLVLCYYSQLSFHRLKSFFSSSNMEKVNDIHSLKLGLGAEEWLEAEGLHLKVRMVHY